MSSNDIGEDGNSSLTCPLDEAQIAKDEHAIEDSWEKYNSFWDMLELHKCGAIGGSHGSNAGELMFDEVFRVLEYVKGSMSLHLSEGLSDAYEVLEVMVHNLKLLNKALNHPSEKDMDAKNMTEELEHIYAKLQDTKLKLQPLMKTFFSVSKINNSADQAAVAAVQEVKAVITNNQKVKGKQSKKSRKKKLQFLWFYSFLLSYLVDVESVLNFIYLN